MQSTPTLCYFEIAGRAEPIRMLCALKNITFTDERVTQEDFGKRKGTGEFPMGSMPVWKEDGMTYFQGSTILRMLGMRTGMYSADPAIAW